MRYLFVVGLLLSGCAQLMNGQTQPVIMKDAKQKIMFTTCGGAVENWGTCSDKAYKACDGKYAILERNQNSTGTSREITFQCKQ